MNDLFFYLPKLLLPLALHLPFEYQYSRIVGRLEDELLDLDKLLNSIDATKKRAIDIGANRGLYTYVLAQIYEVVEAFEPQHSCTKTIDAYRKNFRKEINVHNCALSSSVGEMTLNIPVIEGRLRTTLSTGLASLNKTKGKHESIQVPVHRLDDYAFRDVSFIKIDVEGHEREVIAGAKGTIKREKPILLVEIEQRHLKSLPITVIFDEIKELGYDGYFLLDRRLTSIEEFSYEQHQKLPLSQNQGTIINQAYINNFIFKPN